MKTLLFCLAASLFGLGFSVVQLQDSGGLGAAFWYAVVFFYEVLVAVVLRTIWCCNGR